MRTLFIVLLIFFIMAATATALKQVPVMDDGYMAAKESYKRVNVQGETYWQEIAPSFENAELINDTPNIIVDQNHAGYLVFDISSLDKIGPDNTVVVKLYLDDTQPTADTKFNNNRLSVYVAGPYSAIKGDRLKSMMGWTKNSAGSSRGPGSSMLADITQTVVDLQEFGVAKVILRLEPTSFTNMNTDENVYGTVQLKTLESGHPAEIIIV